MNRSYRTVWNSALGAWVAAPEHARARSKGGRAATAVVAAASALVFMAGGAQAQTYVNVLIGTGGAGSAGRNPGGAGGIGGGGGGDNVHSSSGSGGGPGAGAGNASDQPGASALQPDPGSPSGPMLDLVSGDTVQVDNILAVGGGGGGSGARGDAGGDGTRGAIRMTGGMLSAGTFVIGGGGGGSGSLGDGGGRGGDGTVRVSGADSVVTVGGTLHVGGDGGGTGGQNARSGGAGGTGVLDLSAGTVSAASVVLGGADGAGRIWAPGGSGGDGTLNLSGTVALSIDGGAGVLTVRRGGTLNIGRDSGGVGDGATAGGVALGFSKLDFTGAGALNFVQSDAVVFMPLVTGTGALRQNGPGTTTLTAANTYSGGTFIGAGTLALAGMGRIGSGALTLADAAGAAFDISSASGSVSVASLAGGGAAGGDVRLGAQSLTVGSNNQSTTFGGAFSGTGSVIKVGSGTLTLAGSSSHEGGTQINGGTLVAAASGALGTGIASVGAGASLVLDKGTTQTSLVQLAGNGARLTNNGTLDTTAQPFATAVEGLAGFTGVGVDNGGRIASNAGEGAVTLRGSGASVTNRAGASISTTGAAGSAVVLYDGGSIDNAGTLTGGAYGVLVWGDATVNNAGTISASRPGSAGVNFNFGAHTALVNQAGGVIEGDLTGANVRGGALAQFENAGTVRATSLVGNAAAVRVSGGSANIARNLAGGRIEAAAGIGVQMENGSVLNAHGATISAPTAIAITDATQAASVTNHGVIVGNITMGGGNATLNLGADGSFRGRADAGLRSQPGVVKAVALIGTEGGTAAAGTLDGAQLAGFDTLDVNAANAVWTLSGNFSHAGGTTLRAGRLNLAGSGALGSGELAMDDGTTLGFAADGLMVANAIRFTGIADPTIDTGAFTGTLSGAISGAGDLTKTGSGTLVLSGANVYTGATTVAEGTLRAGAANTFSAASAHTVAAGATLDLAGFGQRLASLDNSGTVSLAGAAPGATLTVTGAYKGNGGVLRLGTALGDSRSLSDRLVLSGAGASATGTTTVQIVNLGGLGAPTAGNGIEVVSAEGGATTTAQTTRDAFALASGHVDAGAYEYRLHAGDAGGAGENWYLRSTTDLVVPVDPGTPATPGAPRPALPTYRSEVPLLAALPEQLRQANLAMLGNLHLRHGDGEGGRNDAGAQAAAPGQRQAWGRVISTDLKIAQRGTVNPASEGRLSGFQAGTDLYADARWRAGLYAGQLDGDMSVTGFARGVLQLGVGRNDLRNQYLGAYATWRGEGGLYANAVLQAGRHRYTVAPITGFAAAGKGDSLLASVEIGRAFAVAPGWTVEPQLQLVRQHLSLDELGLAGARVQQRSDDAWLVRAGVRVKGEVATGAGLLQPYARLNLYRASRGTDVARFASPAALTDIASATGHTSTELAAGATLALGERTSLYGEVGRLWASGGESRVRSPVQAALGLRVKW